ncbi:MAG TPA: flagellar hook-basal body complex protein FliE [Tepidisphaeraceae bacterium]|jgi:flagellar hook-basal body complex protein FliE|nr:flagellar hook-basal body complex protein FliE [Tepidisphaeraceae bacterium]
MLNGVNNLAGVGKAVGTGLPAKPTETGAAGGASFSDVLKNSIDEVTRLQQDASQAVENLATGQTDNVSGVMTAMEKADLAFKTLLAIRAKLMDAYEEIKTMQV